MSGPFKVAEQFFPFRSPEPRLSEEAEQRLREAFQNASDNMARWPSPYSYTSVETTTYPRPSAAFLRRARARVR